MTNSAPPAKSKPDCWESTGPGAEYGSAAPARVLVSGRCRPHASSRKPIEGSDRSFLKWRVMNEFDEYPAEAVLKLGLPQVLEKSPEVSDLHRVFEHAKDTDERKRSFQQMFEAVIGMWVSGELAIDGVESWPDFCARVDRGIAALANSATLAGDSVVFTSGGPIGVAMRRALHLSHADTLQLTWMSRNASFTEFLSSGDRFTLSTFNAHPHLEDERLLTYR